MSAMSTKSRRQSGFTIVELLTVVTVLSILVGLVLGTLGDFYSANTTSLSQSVQTTDTRSILRTIENDMLTSPMINKQLVVGNLLGPSDTAGTWDYKGNDIINKPENRVLIVSGYATDKPASDSTRQLLYVNPSSCPSTATPATYQQVYFVRQDPVIATKYNLYRRTIVPGNLCSSTAAATAAQKQSCKSTLVSANPATCKASDALLLSDVDKFTVNYYTNASDAAPIDAYGAGDIAGAKAIKISVTTNRRVNGSTTQSTADVRISLLN